LGGEGGPKGGVPEKGEKKIKNGPRGVAAQANQNPTQPNQRVPGAPEPGGKGKRPPGNAMRQKLTGQDNRKGWDFLRSELKKKRNQATLTFPWEKHPKKKARAPQRITVAPDLEK